MSSGEKLGETPSRLPATDLGSAFGPPDRSAGLSGKLQPPPRPRPSPVAAAEAATDAADAPSPAPKTARKRAKRVPDAESAVPVQVIVYLPLSVKERLRAAAQAAGTTYTSLTLDAIDATHTRLDDLLGTSRPLGGPRHPGSLFGMPIPAAERRNHEARVQVSVRLLRRDIDVLDELAARHQVSRSGLITAALAAHLTQQLGM